MKKRALILCGVLCIPGVGSADDLRPLPAAANGRVHEVEAVDPDTWSAMLLADVQDGFAYIPELFEAAERAGVRAIVIAGDLSRTEGGDHLELIAREMRTHPPAVPLFAVPGNHDCSTTADREQFARIFGSTRFDFRIGRTRFIGLDSTRPDEEVSMLRSALDARRDGVERTILVRHHPLGAGGEGGDALRRVVRDRDVGLVISGHGHTETFEQQAGSWSVVLPASGDRDKDDRNKPVSYVILRSTPGGLSFETHRIPRSFLLDLRGDVAHLVFAHLLPSVSPAHLTLAAGLLPLLVLGGAGLSFRTGRRRSSGSSRSGSRAGEGP